MKNHEDMMVEVDQKTPVKLAPAAGAALSPCFRRLKRDELVTRGDFVEDELHGFEPWEGPTGFRADAFVKPIYRQDKIPRVAAKRNR